MKTNYKIGETYYLYHEKVRLHTFVPHDKYPLKGESSSGNSYTFTSDGRHSEFDDSPSLSTSPTEFIAPKEDKTVNQSIDSAILVLRWLKEISNCTSHDKRTENKSKIEIFNAIKLLKSEGYTITKQY